MESKSANVLRKEIGLPHSIAMGLNALIGAGIFVSPVGILSHVGSIGTSLVLWIVCAVTQLLFALCYAELGCRIPLSGGEYSYFNQVYGGFLACVRIWSTSFNVMFIQSILLWIFSKYISEPLFPSCDTPKVLLSFVYIVGLGVVIAVNYYSVWLVARLQLLFTFTKLIALTGIIILGVVHMLSGELGQLAEPFKDSNYSPIAFTLAFYSGTWALRGWEVVCCVTGEMKHPKRDLRITLIVSITFTSIMYMLANIAYASVLTKEEVLSSPAVAVLFAQKSMGPVAWMMSTCIAVAVLGTSMCVVLALSRMLYMGAKQGHMPSVLGFLSVERRTPAVGLIYMGILSMVGVFGIDVFYMIEVNGFINISCQALTVLALIILRHRDKSPGTGIIKAPFAVPEICLMIECLLLVITIYQRPWLSAAIMFVMFGCSSVIYIICVKLRKRPNFYIKGRDAVTIMLQKLLICLPEEDSVNFKT